MKGKEKCSFISLYKEVHLRYYGVWFGKVYCDLQSDGGGWTVIQRRKEPVLTQEDFEKTWQEYSSGFGTLHDSHWLGTLHITYKFGIGDRWTETQLC